MRLPQLLLLTSVASVFTSPASAHLRHFEVASPEPDRVFLTFHGDPATSRAVTWRTDRSVKRGFAEIAVALGEPRFDRNAVRLEAETEKLELDQADGNEQGEVHYHSVVFGDLEPGTLYAYRVGDGEDTWSEWVQFRTALVGHAPFEFVYFGDAQNDVLSHWSRVIRMAAQVAPRAAIALHAGDLINRAHADGEWAGWFKAGGFLHSQWTGIPVTGNHEYGKIGLLSRERSLSMQWRPQFTLPVVGSLPESLHESVYTVDYQGTRFLVLNSNREIEAQMPYIEQQLSEPGLLWRVVTFHHPLFSPGSDRDNDELRARWKPLFDRHGVDLVLQGHDHTYARGHVPVVADGEAGEAAFGTMYVTSVSGPKMYDILEGKFEIFSDDGYVHTRQAENTQFFQVISVAPGELTYEAYTATGDLYDRAVITKDHTTGEKTIDQQVPPVEERTHENTEAYER